MIYKDKTPVYIQLKNSLMLDIKNGRYPENSSLPAVNVIADNAGVSVRTAYLAIQELIAEGICFKRPKKGTIVGKSVKHSVCAVWANYNGESPLEYPLASVFYCGLLQGCAENNITPILIADDPETVIKRYDRSYEFDFKGVIVLDYDKFNDSIELAKKFPDKKFFFVNYVMKNLDTLPPNMIAVVNDNYHGAYRMIEHYISCGCKDFMFFSVKLDADDRTYHNRVKGALAALKDYSLDFNKKNMIITAQWSQKKDFYLAMVKVIRSGRRPQVIFCVNDVIAAAVSKVLAEENISGIKVCGYDYIFPYLSEKWGFDTVKVPYTKMVLKSLACLESDEVNFEKVIRMQPEIKINRKEL